MPRRSDEITLSRPSPPDAAVLSPAGLQRASWRTLIHGRVGLSTTLHSLWVRTCGPSGWAAGGSGGPSVSSASNPSPESALSICARVASGRCSSSRPRKRIWKCSSANSPWSPTPRHAIAAPRCVSFRAWTTPHLVREPPRCRSPRWRSALSVERLRRHRGPAARAEAISRAASSLAWSLECSRVQSAGRRGGAARAISKAGRPRSARDA